MTFGLKDEVIDKIVAVFSLFPEVEKAILYGSRAKGNYKQGSDIDIALVGKKINLTILNKIELVLDDLFLPYTFDICIFHQISNIDLIDHIERIGIILFQKQ